jgi:hypothetical protein
MHTMQHGGTYTSWILPNVVRYDSTFVLVSCTEQNE